MQLGRYGTILFSTQSVRDTKVLLFETKENAVDKPSFRLSVREENVGNIDIVASASYEVVEFQLFYETQAVFNFASAFRSRDPYPAIEIQKISRE